MLEIESLHVAVGKFRLSEFKLSVALGECHAVLGPSGAGKSTLLNAMLGVLSPVSGSIRLDGSDLTQLPIERRGLGYVPQQLGLFPHLTVRDNLTYSAKARKVPAATFQPLLEKLVAATGIDALLDRRPTTLSGGERQRVGLVRALASQPRLILLDEPFASLNESLRRELWVLLRGLQHERQLTILLITHDLAEAYFLANSVTVLQGGRIAQQGLKAEVYTRPATSEVAHFLGIETLLSGRVLHTEVGMATVAVGKVKLLSRITSEICSEMSICIRGEEVMLVREYAQADNLQNVLPARIVSICPGTPLWRIELDAGFPLVASLSRPVVEALALQTGLDVTACIDASSVHLCRNPSV